jgi:hypothetical protein
MYGPFDKQLELRNVADGAETSTATETGIAFDALMAGDFKAIIYVTAVAATGTKAISIETDSEVAFGDSPVSIASATITGIGVYELPMSASQIAKLDPNAAAIRAKATLGGTTPSVTYGAYLVPTV